MTIFIQIAAYRDSELGPTIQDCLAKAKRPTELRFGLCVQDELDVDYGVDFDDTRIRLIRVPWQESLGVCWARSLAQSLYDGERYLLQIDSHHRFIEHWDEKLIGDLAHCDSAKPVLSTYPASYNPITEKCSIGAPNKILISRFDHKGSLKRYPLGYKAKKGLRPIPARFIAAGFLFAQGQFSEDIPYDPELYFAGEEPSLTLRAFTHGYDIFHPQRNILWHEYVRQSKPKHWVDHMAFDDNKSITETNIISEREGADMQRFYDLLKPDNTSQFGLGRTRNTHEYERFAGLDLTNQVVHQNTRLGIDPVDLGESVWLSDSKTAIDEKKRLKSWLTHLDFSTALTALESVKVAVLTYYNRDQQLVDRVTINNRNTPSNGVFEREFESSSPPSHWVLTGFTQSNTWEKVDSGRIYDYRLLAN